MKIKNILSFAGGVAVYTIIALLLMSYGNIKNHTTINDVIVEGFQEKFINSLSAPEKFKNYTIVFDGSLTYPGDGVISGGMFSITESEVHKNVRDWIKHGGFSADEPQIHNSLRHFFDPIEGEGNRFLTDVAKGPLMSLAQNLKTNPRIDDLEWALYGDKGLSADDPDNHNYTWERGKMWMKMAFEEPNRDKRDKLMAKAWRALGETLHMIGDHGCPAHVRDDSHPGPLGYSSYFGDPDPYEEIMESDYNGLIKTYASNKPDSKLRDELRSYKKVKDIGHALAVYTNKYFFTNQTINGDAINGKEIKQIIHPEYAYASPKITPDNYEPNEFYYYNDISGSKVKMCTDLSYVFEKYKLGAYRSYPYINAECVKSQAAVLVPNIIEAGANVIKLYIPAFKVYIDEYDAEEKVLKGKIVHTTDEEYTDKIYYSGPVQIYVNDKHKVDADAYDGEFELYDADFKNGEELYANIVCGGINVKSDDFKVTKQDDLAKYKKVTISFNMQWIRNNQYEEWRGIDESGMELQYMGNGKFVGEISREDDNGSSKTIDKRTIILEVSMDFSKIKRIEYSNLLRFEYGGGDFSSELGEFVAFDIPKSGWYDEPIFELDNPCDNLESASITREDNLQGSSKSNYRTNCEACDKSGYSECRLLIYLYEE